MGKVFGPVAHSARQSLIILTMDEFAAGQLLDWNGRGEGIWTFGKHVPSASDNADSKTHASHVQYFSGHHFIN
jgi:hypothetical protein